MLPLGVTTLLANPRVDHPAPAVIRVHGRVYVSSPKNHAHPAGLLSDRSVNTIDGSSGPEEVVVVKSATGAVADTPETKSNKKTTDIPYTAFPIIFNTSFL